MKDEGRKPWGMIGERSQLALLMLIALAHGLVYAFGVPLWQAPDEPMLYEYAALTAELGRIPLKEDRSPALERRLIESLYANDFWRYRQRPAPTPMPETLAGLRQSIYMPRQVGGDPPVYFALAAIPLRLAAGWRVDAQVYLLRTLNALLLPLSIACVYLAAQEIVRPGAPLASVAPAAAAALTALHPMYVFIGAMLSNDGMANLLGALLCLLIARAVRRGLPGRDLIVITLLALVAMQTKRTAIPFGLMAALLAAIWLGRHALRGGPGALRRRGLALGALVVAPILAVALLSSQLAWDRAARWYDTRSFLPAPRALAGGGYALVIEPGDEVIQALPDVATQRLRNGALRAGARVWGDGPVTGRLVVYTGDRRTEFAFAVERMSAAELSAAVPSTAPDVRFGIVADSGRLYASDVWMRGVGLPGALVSNGDLARPALRPDSPLQPLVSYLRVEELLWLVQSGRPAWGLAFGEWGRWLFFSFWGHFGWMDLPFVRDSPWEPAILAMVAAGLVGVAVALALGTQARRAPLLALGALLPLGLAPVLAQAMVDPYPIQQGRYLFPVLPALAALLAVGQGTLAPQRARQLWLACWLGFWLACAGAALIRLAGFYYA